MKSHKILNVARKNRSHRESKKVSTVNQKSQLLRLIAASGDILSETMAMLVWRRSTTMSRFSDESLISIPVRSSSRSSSTCDHSHARCQGFIDNDQGPRYDVKVSPLNEKDQGSILEPCCQDTSRLAIPPCAGIGVLHY